MAPILDLTRTYCLIHFICVDIRSAMGALTTTTNANGSARVKSMFHFHPLRQFSSGADMRRSTHGALIGFLIIHSVISVA